jgi:hypothetical protein
MPHAPNKLLSRAEVRNILRSLAKECSRMQVVHRDAFRHDPSHDEKTCRFCSNWQGEIDGLERAISHFGGRR